MALKSQIDDLRQNLEEHADILNRLQSVPEYEAVSIIRRLRTTHSVSTVLTSIDDGASTAYRPSDLQDARAVPPRTRSKVEFELAILHEKVYPLLAPPNSESIDVNGLLRTAQQKSPGSQSRSPQCGTSARRASFESELPQIPSYCDDRLTYLEIDYWTKVPLSNVFAASAISMYLENDHPILGFFDADLILTDLINHQLTFCSAFLVSSLLYLACQSYALVDSEATSIGIAFFAEAERLWGAERSIDTPATLTAMMVLGHACNLDGREEFGLLLFAEVRLKAARMKLFGVPYGGARVQQFHQMSPEELRENSHAAWGAYNWLSIHAMLFHEDPIRLPPSLPIPGDVKPAGTDSSIPLWPPHTLPGYMGQTFTFLSKFCTIIQEIQATYFGDDKFPLAEKVSLAFAEAKYQKLLSWADTLSTEVARGNHSSAHVFVLHGLFHGVVLDIFRPFVQQDSGHQLRSFSSSDSTPTLVCAASLNQLKRLAYIYVTQLQPVCYSPTFSTALLHLNHAILHSHGEMEWRFYFALCMDYFKKVSVQYRCYADVVRAHLSMGMRSGILTSQEARQFMVEFNQSIQRHAAVDQAVNSCIVDFNKAMTAPHEAQAHRLALQFEDLAMFNEFTTGDHRNLADKEVDSTKP